MRGIERRRLLLALALALALAPVLVAIAVTRAAISVGPMLRFWGLGEGSLAGVEAIGLRLSGLVGGHVGSSGLAIGCPVGGLPRAGLL